MVAGRRGGYKAKKQDGQAKVEGPVRRDSCYMVYVRYKASEGRQAIQQGRCIPPRKAHSWSGKEGRKGHMGIVISSWRFGM